MHFGFFFAMILTDTNVSIIWDIVSTFQLIFLHLTISMPSQTMMNGNHDECDRGNESLLIKKLFVHSTSKGEQVGFFFSSRIFPAGLG